MLHHRTVDEPVEHVTSKQRAAVQREVVRLLDELAPERSPQRREASSSPIAAHRWPGRCILQGESTAVSVSWFPARPAEEALGEMLVIAWDGVIAVPGAARRANATPVARATRTLRPREGDDGDWLWLEGDAEPMPTEELVSLCRRLVEE